MDVADAVKAAIYRHYPVDPVVDADRHVIGVVRGWRLFERQAIEISAQSGQMVGVDREERLYTGLWTAFKMRHGWLQVNLLGGLRGQPFPGHHSRRSWHSRLSCQYLRAKAETRDARRWRSRFVESRLAT